MSNINGRDVKVARVHQSFHIEGLGNLGPGAITKDSAKGVIGGLTMTKVDGGVYLKAGSTEGYIPDANIVGVQFSLVPIASVTKIK